MSKDLFLAYYILISGLPLAFLIWYALSHAKHPALKIGLKIAWFAQYCYQYVGWIIMALLWLNESPIDSSPMGWVNDYYHIPIFTFMYGGAAVFTVISVAGIKRLAELFGAMPKQVPVEIPDDYIDIQDNLPEKSASVLLLGFDGAVLKGTLKRGEHEYDGFTWFQDEDGVEKELAIEDWPIGWKAISKKERPA